MQALLVGALVAASVPAPVVRVGAGLVYEDRRSNYVTSEVGLAYSAPAVLLAASLGG